MLRIDTNLIWIIVNLIILYVVLRKLLFNRVLGIVERRKKMVADDFARAKKANEEAVRLKAKYEASIAGVREESQRIMAEATDRGASEYRRITQRALDEAEKIREKTDRELVSERERTMREIRSEVASLAMAASAKIIGESDLDRTDSGLYDEFLETTE